MENPVTKSAEDKFCKDCGAVIHVKAEICPKCGVRQQAAVTTPANGKSRIAAALLAFFLGGFGVHKFYLGQVGLGILYLVFFWTLIPGVIAFIEFILLLVMSDEDFARKYG